MDLNIDENTFVCQEYNPDNIFKRFKVVEFPISFVGLSTTQELDVEVNISEFSYLKTMCAGNLLIFEEARKVSAPHRAFDLTPVNDHTLKIVFKPLSECISKMQMHRKHVENRFVFDLRLIRVDGKRCCNTEHHAEIGRYYVSGQYEYCNISHSPQVVNFGDVMMNTKEIKYMRIRNESKLIAAKINYVKVVGYEVLPIRFTIPPNSSKRISISLKPTCLKMGNTLVFQIRNPYDLSDETDDNFIYYTISTAANIVYKSYKSEVIVESLHKLFEQNPCCTYLGEDLTEHKKRKEMGRKFLEVSKHHIVKPKILHCTGNEKCYSDSSSMKPIVPGKDFCKIKVEYATKDDLFHILLIPFTIDFGEIGINTYGEHDLIIKNNTKYDVTVNLHQDLCIYYTKEKLTHLNLKLKPSNSIIVLILCSGFTLGDFKGTFKFTIDNKYNLKHPYTLRVSDPVLMVKDPGLKFGMVTSESFVTSASIKIFNNFNVPVDFRWEELHPDVPLEITPISGSVPRHGCKMCEITYISKPTKSKTHEIYVVSKSTISQVIPIEINVITRKLSIKFLQQAVLFKDIPINIETVEYVKLENSSREFALFHVVEPILPGITIEPMSGIIRPKMIMVFNITVKICCILEFAFDVMVKINNKENLIVPISGNVIEPKIVIQPKNIYMPRVPCGMVSYVPITMQNHSALQAIIEVLDTGDENIFNVYIAQGNEKQRVFEFFIEGGQSKTVFIKVFDIFRREYEMFIPFRVNRLLGPPSPGSWSTDLQHYIGKYEEFYDGNPKVKMKIINKDISYCRISGVITVPWIEFSTEKFEIDYVPSGDNSIHFTMTNVSKYYLHVTILTAKLSPCFTLNVHTQNNESIITENNIKFEFDRRNKVELEIVFHPKGHGRFVAVAPLYLDKYCSLPYYNLTFYGKRETPLMTPSFYRIIFPPCYVGAEVVRTVTLKFEDESDLDSLTCSSKEESNLVVKFVELENVYEEEQCYTIVTVNITFCSQISYSRHLILSFHHVCGSSCDVEAIFSSTYCPLTLHTDFFVKPTENPYPYYPLSTQTELYDYLDTCSTFLEKWMFQQGFRRDLFPVIPDSFHAISSSISAPAAMKQSKSINVSYLNYIRRIAGPLMKHVRKITVHGVDESFKYTKEIHDTYREIINLLRARGANLSALQAMYLLNYDQFVSYAENVPTKSNADLVLVKELLDDLQLFNRLNKQSWIDFILQSYKVFVLDSCFFDCVCVSSQPRDIIKIILDWYNEHILALHNKLRGKNKQVKVITNLTTDLSDGIALISAFLNYCPFLEEHFTIFCEIDENESEGSIINNACLIIDAMNLLRLCFPLNSKDLLQPNFLQMLFLSIHLYVTLPMFKIKDTIKFCPPLLRSSSRLLAVNPTSQESLSFVHITLNNRNDFSVEKVPTGDNARKMYLTITFNANFVQKSECLLLLHGYNKTRIFDTYIMFVLVGTIGALNPVKKCKVTGPLYRPIKVDILVTSPFTIEATYKLSITDVEPSIPVTFQDDSKGRFYVRRLNLMERELALVGTPKEGAGSDLPEHKLYMQMICLNTQIGNTWIWFRSEVGEFFLKITTQPRWDLAIDTLQAKVDTWPMDPCSCGEACECYRTTLLMIPHRIELMVKSLRYALLENASDAMINIFDDLIESTTGKIILGMLLAEGGTNITEVQHILREHNTYRITSRSLLPRLDRATLAQHSDAVLALPVTVPPNEKAERYSVTLVSDCGMDIRTYRILFIEKSAISTQRYNY